MLLILTVSATDFMKNRRHLRFGTLLAGGADGCSGVNTNNICTGTGELFVSNFRLNDDSFCPDSLPAMAGGFSVPDTNGLLR